jgi:hypothetical protein
MIHKFNLKTINKTMRENEQRPRKMRFHIPLKLINCL